MSELNNNGFFDAIKRKKDQENAERVLKCDKIREDQWWRLYKQGLVEYE